tara:strand:+ start:3169 stop:3291 length:123 start_codon:yes stop_codon:yes gene_type:complete
MFLGTAPLVMGLLKLFGLRGDKVDKENKKAWRILMRPRQY